MEVLVELPTCRRCGGSGTLVIRLGVSDPTRDTHALYKGSWTSYSSKCSVCYGTGKERYQWNRMANVRISYDIDGNVQSLSAVADTSPYTKGNHMTQPNEATFSPLLTNPTKLRDESEALIASALLLLPEDEIFVPDKEYTMEDMTALRSRLSRMRKAIDFVNKGLAIHWKAEFPGEAYIDEDTDTIWWVGQTKGKRIVDDDSFYAWLETKDAEELSKLISATAVKVGGMSPVERETNIDETPRNDDVTIQNKPRSVT